MMKSTRPGFLALLVVLIMVGGCATRVPADTSRLNPATDLFLVSVDAQRAYRESRWIDAVRLYQALVEQLPSDATAWFHLANTYAQQGAFGSAIHAYEQSLRYDRAQPKAWFNLSSVYLFKALSAMHQSSTLMVAGDPSRSMIAERMQVIDDLVQGRAAPGMAVDSTSAMQRYQAVQR